MLGKTNTPEGVGWKGETTNRVAGTTFNPWNLERTPGGSSGGAGAAVAAGLGPLAQGGDGAGSIRIPAAFSGIFGYKPSFGRIPLPRQLGDADGTSGPDDPDRSRRVDDARRHGRSRRVRPLFAPVEAPSFAEDIEGGIAGCESPGRSISATPRHEPEIADLTAAAAVKFEELGCTVEEAHPGLDDPWRSSISSSRWARPGRSPTGSMKSATCSIRAA
ncbi:MAG: amidase family protein [Thermomicrobiales bacterium]